MAYAHPADVFFLQIQGSGRLVLPELIPIERVASNQCQIDGNSSSSADCN
ncbi:MAG: hypothetical protein AAF346_15260 [Pseudomonadota bacterium]